MEKDTRPKHLDNETDIIWSRVCTAFAVTGSKRLRRQIIGPEEVQKDLASTVAESGGLNHSQITLLITRLKQDDSFARKAVEQVEAMHRRSGISQESMPRTYRGKRNIIVEALHRLEDRLIAQRLPLDRYVYHE